MQYALAGLAMRQLLTELSACSTGKGLTVGDVRALLERHVSLDDVDLAKLAKQSRFPRQVSAQVSLKHSTMATRAAEMLNTVALLSQLTCWRGSSIRRSCKTAALVKAGTAPCLVSNHRKIRH